MVKLSAVGFDRQLSTQLVRYDWFRSGENFLKLNKIQDFNSKLLIV